MTIDPASFTTRGLVNCGPSVHKRYLLAALLDSGSPRAFVQEAVWARTKRTGAATAACDVFTPPRVWGGLVNRPTSASKSKSAEHGANSTMAMNLPPNWLLRPMLFLLVRCNTLSCLDVIAERVSTRAHRASLFG